MIAVGDVALLRPLLLLLLVPALAVALFVRTRGGLGDWQRAVDAPLFAALRALGRVADAPGGRSRFGPLALAGLIAVVALSGPAVRRSDGGAYRNLDGLVVAVDLSRSMTEGDGFGDARFAAADVVKASGSRQAALIAYAGDAYLAATFTSDHAALGELVAVLGPDLVPDQGSDPARALRLAGERLAAAGILAGDVVMVTDGGGIADAALAEARRLAVAGMRVHVLLAPGAAPDDAAADADGAAAAARLAAAGGGILATVADPGPVDAAVGDAATTRLGRSAFASLGWFDVGRPLMLLPALLLLTAIRRRR